MQLGKGHVVFHVPLDVCTFAPISGYIDSTSLDGESLFETFKWNGRKPETEDEDAGGSEKKMSA